MSVVSSVGMSERLEWWVACHCALFLVFYWFLSPLQHIQDKSHNSQYFWGLHILTYFLLVNVLRHTPAAPRVVAVPFQFTQVATFFVPALFIGVPGFCIAEGAFRTRGLSVIRTYRELINNYLLMTSAVSLQYGFCTQQRGDLPSGISTYCECLDHPVTFQFPVVLTIGTIFACSWALRGLFGRRHGFFSCGPPIDTNVTEAERLRGPHPSERKHMVPWYSLSMTTHLFDLILMMKVFLGKFDARVLLAAQTKGIETDFTDLSERDDLWFDFLADGGDGFDSTYTISRLLAQPHLPVELPSEGDVHPQTQKALLSTNGALRPRVASGGDELASLSKKGGRSSPSLQRVKDDSPLSASGKTAGRFGSTHSNTLMLPRANVVFHGGDVAYPSPSNEEFVDRFIRPLEWALPRVDPEDSVRDSNEQPEMFIIPGNHDWHDGLETFLHWIVNSERLAGWKLPQKHTYYAVKLPHGWWVWGLDLGLSYDLDRPQYDYFCALLEAGTVEAEDRVVVLTHRPNWVYDVAMGERTGYTLNVLLDKIGEPRLAMRIAGDLHHYTRYVPGDGSNGPPLVTSGGAGAFLHPTHYPPRDFLSEANISARLGDQNGNGDAYAAGQVSLDLPGCISKASGTGYTRVCSYPDENLSRKLTWMNLIHFRNRNWGADVVLGLSYILMVISAVPLCGTARVLSQPDFLLVLKEFFLLMIETFYTIFNTSYLSLLTHCCFLACMIALAETHMGVAWKLGVGVVHYACHAIAAVACICLAECATVYLAQLHTMTSGESPEIVRFLDGILLEAAGSGYEIPLYLLPSALNTLALSICDLPRIIATNREAACVSMAAGQALTRFDYAALVAPLVPYLWIIITPIASFIFGCYLSVSLNFLGQHWTEAFSSLKIQDYKNFLRMHISPVTGDLHCFVVGVDHVPTRWEMDPYWDKTFMPRNAKVPSWKWVTPSKYRPRVQRSSKDRAGQIVKSGSRARVVDFFVVKASRKRGPDVSTPPLLGEDYYTEEEAEGSSVDVPSPNPVTSLIRRVSSLLQYTGSNESLRDDFNM
ncbi:hypothetical protein FOZ61_007563 [Perkinsus olseni]|uniref:Calcineurin-like phosphoesterase domain-containing protein n=1 Tax=Perkinsus olseni TaxID=32597 RepID=A0A7J6M9K9_PEROL|nr:hypothetical protein FOZ61_007563 [Perkinsus olseni]KAF4668195.1 hypothetical protein FOL46_002102 [Perkinsus olseni]